MSSSPRTMRLYELVLADGTSMSPYVWRIRYALAHKGLSAESVPLGFTAIPGVFDGRFKTVPILECGTTVMNESWDIAEFLDREFADRPAIFSSPAENAMVRLFDGWFFAEVIRRLFLHCVLDIHDAARPEDRAYFRQSREKRLQAPLEEVAERRVAGLPALRQALAPLRTQLGRFPFLGGAVPNYADYIALGAFKWVSGVCTLPMFAADDTVLRDYLQRGFDLYGGLARGPVMKPLFE